MCAAHGALSLPENRDENRAVQFSISARRRSVTMSETMTGMAVDAPRSARSRKPTWNERIEFRLLVVLAFTFCLVGYALRRIAGRAPKDKSYWSCVTDAKSAAYAAVGYAFSA
jgi:hypothetical protein